MANNFKSFVSTVNPYKPREWPNLQRVLFDSITGSPTGLEWAGTSGPHGIWTPIDVTAAQVASPDALMLADRNATYRLNVAPYTRYYSNGTALITIGGAGLVFDPREYGAPWNGTDDDYAGLQAAINAAVLVNGTVLLPYGTGRLSQYVTTTGVGSYTLRGQGSGTILKPLASNVASVLVWTVANNSVGVRVQDLVFDGSGQSSALVNPLTQLFRATDVMFENVTWQNCGGIGLNCSQSNAIKVRNCNVLHAGNRWKTTLLASSRSSGLSFSPGLAGLWGFNNSVTGTHFEDIGLDAINTGFQVGFVAANNTFNLENNQRALVPTADYPSAIYPAAGTDFTITGNKIKGAQGQGIDAYGVRNSTISGNAIADCGGAGIGIFSSTSQVEFTADIASGTMTVSVVASGTLAVGMAVGSVTGTAVTDGTYILALGTGTGGVGTYTITNSGQTIASQDFKAAINCRALNVSDNVITSCGRWSASVWKSGITIGDGIADGVTITDNVCVDQQSTKTQPYGFAVITKAAGWTCRPINLVLEGNQFAGNLTGPILDPSTALSKVIANNGGIFNVIGTIASGATLTLPFNPVISLTGSATATVIAAPATWTGRQGTFIPTGAAVFTAGATIGNTVTCVANVPLGFTFDGTKLFLG